ncbi:MAG TPA: hypothetical protein VFG69_00710 [Nannocystaceae bacterium]|nr:hypothetical protein [Nannocystaceae bacterium]
MRGGARRIGASLWLAASACSFDSSGDGGSAPGSSTSEGSSADDADDGAPTTSSAATSASASADDGTDDGDDGTDSGGSDTQTDTGNPTMPGCPEPWPAEWVFCNDFDDASDAELFSNWEPSDDRLAIVAGTGLDGSGGLQFTHGAGSGWTGRATVDFADSPEETEYRGERLTEVYVRVYVRTQAEWPGLAAGDLLGLSVRDVPGMPFDTAVDVSVVSNSGELGLVARPNRCFTGGNPGCGMVTFLEPTEGMTPIWSSELADSWHCVELHLALEHTGGDGLVELRVDGDQDGRRGDYVFVEDWAERGWNAFRITGSWPAEPPEGPLQRWMDDLVISREPIGCR